MTKYWVWEEYSLEGSNKPDGPKMHKNPVWCRSIFSAAISVLSVAIWCLFKFLMRSMFVWNSFWVSRGFPWMRALQRPGWIVFSEMCLELTEAKMFMSFRVQTLVQTPMRMITKNKLYRVLMDMLDDRNKQLPKLAQQKWNTCKSYLRIFKLPCATTFSVQKPKRGLKWQRCRSHLPHICTACRFIQRVPTNRFSQHQIFSRPIRFSTIKGHSLMRCVGFLSLFSPWDMAHLTRPPTPTCPLILLWWYDWSNKSFVLHKPLG